MLALPFAMVKRSELPTPRKGQAEYDLFEEITGKDWHEMDKIEVDHETKITEFDYENYIHKGALKDIDTNSESFK